MTTAFREPHARSRRRWWWLALAVAGAAFAAWAKVRISHLDTSTQATNPIIRWEYLFKRPETRSELWTRTTEHLQLTVVPVALGLLISSMLAAIGLRFRWLLTPITLLSGFLYTIPSLALFGVLVTYTTNWTAAVVALTSYTLLILVRNIVAGIDGVPSAVTDAADGLGMGRVRRLISVELPLALPVILTGVRVATVTTVGLVGISSVIQLGGLGSLIFTGYNSSYPTKMVIGAGLSVLLAVALDLVLRLVERLTTPWARRRVGA
ncbi:MAG: proline/glycine/betaine transporter permease [Acidimicrobiales bacterium]|nr:proline/glycine/betaine transporter permease [Acidimicrobiales bacterium]